jgi:hypothetical protein
VRFTVGGEEYDLTSERVVSAMRGVASESIQKHVVDIDGTAFPPKQAFATVTGRARTSFTTMEAQRVLRRLGFVCREAGHREFGVAARVAAGDDADGPAAGSVDRLASVEATLATLEAAVAGLHARVKELEARRYSEWKD